MKVAERRVHILRLQPKDIAADLRTLIPSRHAKRSPASRDSREVRVTTAPRVWARLLALACALAFIAVAQPAQAADPAPTSGPITIMSGCSTPPCGDIYNNDNYWYAIERQDCENCGWIQGAIGPGEHLGGYWNDGIDWDAFFIPGHCSVTYDVDGSWVTRGNLSTSRLRIGWDSDQTVTIHSHSCW